MHLVSARTFVAHFYKHRSVSNRNKLPRRNQRCITEGLNRFIVARDGVLDPMFGNKKSHEAPLLLWRWKTFMALS